MRAAATVARGFLLTGVGTPVKLYSLPLLEQEGKPPACSLPLSGHNCSCGLLPQETPFLWNRGKP